MTEQMEVIDIRQPEAQGYVCPVCGLTRFLTPQQIAMLKAENPTWDGVMRCRKDDRVMEASA